METNCCKILRKELSPCQDYFSSDDATGLTIDIGESFGPSSVWAILAKVALAGFTIFTWVSMFLASDYKGFFFAYLTIWTLTLQLVYHVFSVWLSLSPPPGINTRVKIAWYFFNMVSNTGILVALLWWGTVYDPDENLTFNLVAPHSATVVVCLVDGLVVNRIPVRLFHWFGSVLPITIAYPVWTVLHSVLDVGNPNESDNDPETNDDILYPSIDWKDDLVGTLVLILVVALAVGPLVQLLLFALSLYSPCCRISRRYLDDDDDKGVDTEDRDAEDQDKSIFASPYW